METGGNPTSKVHVLDLARGQIRWEECASMKVPRLRHGCAVSHGKIYVFGGTSSCRPEDGSEVYDPKANSWSPIRPMQGLRFDLFVETVGEELWLHNGRVFHRAHFESGKNLGMIDFEDMKFPQPPPPRFLEIYHPSKDEWRVVNRVRTFGNVFMARSKCYSIIEKRFTGFCLEVYDAEENGFKRLRKLSFHVIGPIHSVFVDPLAVVAVDDEIIVRVHWFDINLLTQGFCLLQSVGFGSDEIVWQKTQFSMPCANLPRYESRLYTLQL